MIPNSDLSKVIDPYLLANPNMISYGQPPGVLDVDSWFNDNPFTDLGTKYSQKKYFCLTEREQWIQEKTGIDQVP